MEEKYIINGNPSKAFFIDMITRDISIKDAIIDLIDNSIDGANNNSINSDSVKISIELTSDHFFIIDNCGGFSIEDATNYAFRFGRPENINAARGTVGRFGIGMKRALFKMGKFFHVESRTKGNHFYVDVDVDQWKKQTIEGTGEDDWKFTYKILNEGNISNTGTQIFVNNLHPEVSCLFNDENFINDLTEEIEKLLTLSIEKGIKIVVNGKLLVKKDIKIINDDICRPYIRGGQKDSVTYKVYAGLSNVGYPSESGWYIFCNERLVVLADKTELTGWGTLTVPKWHNEFVMFKGIVFIDSPDTIKLPLTTTKKGIDDTSEIYREILAIMRDSMLSILSFLRNVANYENSKQYREQLFEQKEKSTIIELRKTQIETQQQFIHPDIDMDKVSYKDDDVRISFLTKKRLASIVKNHAGARSFKELGEIILDYYVKMEGISDNE